MSDSLLAFHCVLRPISPLGSLGWGSEREKLSVSEQVSALPPPLSDPSAGCGAPGASLQPPASCVADGSPLPVWWLSTLPICLLNSPSAMGVILSETNFA